jgi:SAM-dependent methyltransferase
VSSSTAERDPSRGPEPGAARAAWEQEYARVHAYTTSYRDDLDRGIQFLRSWLLASGTRIDGPVLECACGRGRNALPLALDGHRVIGLDHALQALRQFRARVEGQELDDRVLPIRHDLREPFPIRDASVGAVIDITAVDNLVEPEAQRQYGREIARVLEPGGLALVVTFDRDDGYYAPFLVNSPWPGTGVVEDPHTGIRNQLFRGEQLDALFVPPLERVAANRFDFIDEAASERWTRRFLMRLYRKG